ncbi:Peroxidase 44 [Raphanus sativus]|nr:Peroxidase 44 [Raphanus sativus]
MHVTGAKNIITNTWKKHSLERGKEELIISKMRSITALFFLFCFLAPSALAQLRLGFYGRSCPRAESIVANVVANRFRRDRSITAALLRMQFHDCFVRGCDASLLIDPRPGRPSEKSTGPNASVRGYEIIDEAKRLLEAACPRTVSCSDIVTLATRDSVALAGGPRFSVPTGRRDGLRSSPNDVNLPGPTIPVGASIQLFAAQGMNTNDMVTLIGGGHSVGVAHCSLIQDRLADPAMDRSLNARYVEEHAVLQMTHLCSWTKGLRSSWTTLSTERSEDREES